LRGGLRNGLMVKLGGGGSVDEGGNVRDPLSGMWGRAGGRRGERLLWCKKRSSSAEGGEGGGEGRGEKKSDKRYLIRKKGPYCLEYRKGGGGFVLTRRNGRKAREWRGKEYTTNNARRGSSVDGIHSGGLRNPQFWGKKKPGGAGTASSRTRPGCIFTSRGWVGV